jgi:hypothetical protein
MSCGTENIVLEPMDVYIGKNQVQVQKVTCVADVSSSLNNKYFLLYEPAGTRRYVWFNIGGAGVDPALSGYTAVPVTAAVNASASTIATAVQVAIDALAEFTATVSGGVVTITDVTEGYAPAAHDAQATISQTAFAFELVTVGDTYEKIGYLDGDIEIGNLSGAPVDITTHQTGATVVGQLLSSSGNPELSFALKEVTTAKYKKVRRYASGEFVPVANGSTSLVGAGRLGQFKAPQYTRIVLHPVSKDAADKTRDYCFWKCLLDLDSVTFSGENVLTLPVTAKAFEDCEKPSVVSVWSFGDWTQVEAE